MPAEPQSHPWRRYLRFSVRGLLVLVVVVGGGLGWIVREARIQRKAVAAIEKAEGFVKYEWEWRDGKNISGGKPWAPRWVVDLIGADYFGHVTHVGWAGPLRLPDTVLAEVGRLNQLQRLWLNNASVTDAGLEHFKGLTKLSDLRLNRTQVTDAGLEHLKGLTKLSDLWLDRTQVTDAGVDELKRSLPSLTIRR